MSDDKCHSKTQGRVRKVHFSRVVGNGFTEKQHISNALEEDKRMKCKDVQEENIFVFVRQSANPLR